MANPVNRSSKDPAVTAAALTLPRSVLSQVWSVVLKVITSNAGLKAIALLALIGLWWFLTLFFETFVLPSPYKVAQRMVNIYLHERFIFNMWHTMLRVIFGFITAMLLGMAIGIAMGLSDRLERTFDAVVMVGLTIPGLCWALFSLIFFGPRESAPVFAVTIIVLPYVIMNIWQGTKAVDREIVEMGRAFRASRLTIIRRLILPQLEPYLFAVARYGFASAWKVVVLSEMFGLPNGIGFQLNGAFERLSMSGVLGWTISFTIVMLLVEFVIFKPIETHLTAWRGRVAL